VATLIIIMILPLLVVIAIAIKLDSPGPVLVQAAARGENGRLFTMFKFRSMVTDAEARQASVIHSAPRMGRSSTKGADDPQHYPDWPMIRTTSLDELPQLFT
jgi:lipopolysaccharide/colanic/teichoic acid biosynthesis glycosyltransferase